MGHGMKGFRRGGRRGVLACGAALLLACGGEDGDSGGRAAPEALLSDGPHDVAVLTVKDLGAIRIQLLPELAPNTVANFEKLAREGFYDGTTFHRVIPGFMIQGGDPNTKDNDPRNDGDGGPGYFIDDEISDFPHVRGVVAMANKARRNTAGSQFFIVHSESRHLDGDYTIFGRVVEGMDVVDAVTRMQIDKYGRWGPRDRPYPVSATVESVGIEPAAGAAELPEPASEPAG